MRNIYCHIVLLVVVIASSCQNNNEVEKKCYASYELTGPEGKLDTLNLIDCDKKKQGHWVVTKNIIPKFSILPTDNNKTLQGKIIRRVIEEGQYTDDKKVGYWKYYNEEDGALKDSVLFNNGEAVKN